MNRESLLRELHELYEGIHGPFPYDDLRKMRETERLASHFKTLGDDDWLSADLNTYCKAIHGLASRLSEGSMEDAPTTAIHWLTRGDFFAIFPKYRFLEGEWEQFSQFAHLYGSTKSVLSSYFSRKRECLRTSWLEEKWQVRVGERGSLCSPVSNSDVIPGLKSFLHESTIV